MVAVFLIKDYDPNILLEVNYEIKESDYELAAHLDIEDYGSAWNLTQTFDGHIWYKGELVKLMGKKTEYRSASIGDIYAHEGKLYVIMGNGFKKIKWRQRVTFNPLAKKQNESVIVTDLTEKSQDEFDTLLDKVKEQEPKNLEEAIRILAKVANKEINNN
jgi:hypothetical protein